MRDPMTNPKHLVRTVALCCIAVLLLTIGCALRDPGVCASGVVVAAIALSRM